MEIIFRAFLFNKYLAQHVYKHYKLRFGIEIQQVHFSILLQYLQTKRIKVTLILPLIITTERSIFIKSQHR